MTEEPKSALAHIADQAETIARLAEQLAASSELSRQLLTITGHLQQEVVGLYAAMQAVLEVAMTSSPDLKRTLAEATTQMLARPETLPIDGQRTFIEAINKAASAPSRTTPEGRRAGFQVISNEPSNPDEDR